MTTISNDDADESSGRPKKKQKTSNQAPQASNIIKLTVSVDQGHIVTVTDDKIVRVFGVQTGGQLNELSQRCMPKRPCAIQISQDNTTIICGDKFGDVYSLPLLPEESPATAQQANTGVAEIETSKKEKDATFKPSATNLTVHTQRNRRALASQLAQKDFSIKKEPLKFEHKLQLGHVSMLTDVLCATRDVEDKRRSYIITADRDEHIRISRGLPQSHIIEGYCLGHTEFVSKLCLIPGTDLLVSGGGDDDIYVWDWPTGKLLHKHGLVGAMAHLLPMTDSVMTDDPSLQTATPVVDKVERKVAVSGLCTAPFTNARGQQETALLVTCERLPAIFVIPVDRLQSAYVPNLIALDNPPLDVTCIGGKVLITLDGRKDGERRLLAKEIVQDHDDVQGNLSFKPDEAMETKLECLINSTKSVHSDNQALEDLLYNVANLRKRRGWATPGDDAEGDDEPNGAEGDSHSKE